MKTVLFIGCNPTLKNTDPSVPFIGTKSYDILSVWIETIQESPEMPEFEVILANACSTVLTSGDVPRDSDMDFEGLAWWINESNPDAIITLGKFAERTAKKMGLTYLTLPHPSGRNRQLNDKKYVEQRLAICAGFLKRIFDE
jgi:uracil-DNA glycosylase